MSREKADEESKEKKQIKRRRLIDNKYRGRDAYKKISKIFPDNEK